MTINESKIGREVAIDRVEGEERVVKRLASLGLVRGARVVLMSNECGAAVVRVCESRLAIDYNLARQIFVY